MSYQSYKTYILVLLILLNLSLPNAINSQDYTDHNDNHNSTRYTRVAMINGEVKIFRSSDIEAQPARMNLPVLEGDRVITGTDGSIELLEDNGNIYWLWHETKVDVRQLTSMETGDQTAFELWIGNVSCRFREQLTTSKELLFYAGDSTFLISQGTFFNVSVDINQIIRSSIYEGQLVFECNAGSYKLCQGESIEYNPMDKTCNVTSMYENDRFFNWVSERDRLFSEVSSDEDYIPRSRYYETTDINRNGQWFFNAHLDCWCWAPFVSIGWVPYHFGYWSWIPGWGWTWIPSETWGWLPYHYGYWAFFFDYGWIWVPHWRWGSHWACWRHHNRSVHWVAIHPEDKLDKYGRLMPDVIPKNSELKLGIPVVASQSIDEFLKEKPAQLSSKKFITSNDTGWTSTPPASIPEIHSSESSNNIIHGLSGHSENITKSKRSYNQIRIPNHSKDSYKKPNISPYYLDKNDKHVDNYHHGNKNSPYNIQRKQPKTYRSHDSQYLFYKNPKGNNLLPKSTKKLPERTLKNNSNKFLDVLGELFRGSNKSSGKNIISKKSSKLTKELIKHH